MKAKIFRRVECSVRGGADVVVARVEGREMARELGFDSRECAAIETAISELAWNAVRHAAGGRMIFMEVSDSGCSGLEIVCVDRGSGIRNPSEIRERGGREAADRREGTGTPGLGIGLPLVHRVMDEIEIVRREGGGARVTARKWRDLPSGVRSVELRQPASPSAGSLGVSPAVYPAGGLTCSRQAHGRRDCLGGCLSRPGSGAEGPSLHGGWPWPRPRGRKGIPAGGGLRGGPRGRGSGVYPPGGS
ncbi:MAG: anti-sigma regulatory factor [Nitrospirae bacterium]|nr:anti-sigma regulatory factor [Nitrospirota bacterium]